jgi:hypothetical protein
VKTKRKGGSVTPNEQLAAPDPDATAGSALRERDRRILDFEREWIRHPGAKDEAVRQEFGLTPARYYQVLNAVIDLPAAIVYDPMLVRRLQRVRDARTSERTLQQPHQTTLSRHS